MQPAKDCIRSTGLLVRFQPLDCRPYLPSGTRRPRVRIRGSSREVVSDIEGSSSRPGIAVMMAIYVAAALQALPWSYDASRSTQTGGCTRPRAKVLRARSHVCGV